MLRPITISVSDSVGRVSGRLILPSGATALYVLAHGAGAGMHHPFMEGVAAALAARGLGTLRYQFPYTEAGRRRPDAPAALAAAVRAAVRAAAAVAPGLPLLAGGKSMGGRMTSQAQAEVPLDGVRGLAFLGFPLHAPNRPSAGRAEHLARVSIPMLFLQGTRDTLADLALLRPVVEALGSRAEMHVVEGGDHSFKVPKRSGGSAEDVMADLADAVARWAGEILT